jgi:hypothetical protein
MYHPLYRLIRITLLSALLTTVSPSIGLPDSLPVPLISQETRMWCWAASTQMIMRYFGHEVDQCIQANNRFSLNDCCKIDLCPPPTEPANPCVTGGWPEFDKYGYTFKRTSNTALSWEELKIQIGGSPAGKKKPVAFSWFWPGGGGHMMVVKGFFIQDNKKYVEILDPWRPCYGTEKVITYEFYKESLGHHTHWHDFYDIEYQGGN